MTRQLPSDTVHDWLARPRLKGVQGRATSNHKPMLGGVARLVVDAWMPHAP